MLSRPNDCGTNISHRRSQHEALLARPDLCFLDVRAACPELPGAARCRGDRDLAGFPLHVHIFGVRWNHVNGSYDGYGRADLLGATPQGIDYTFSCSEPFLHNVGKDEFYQARWKKQGMKLEILMQKVGSDMLHKCELKTSVKPVPYGRYGAGAAGAAVPPPPAAAVPQK